MDIFILISADYGNMIHVEKLKILPRFFVRRIKMHDIQSLVKLLR